MSNKNKKISEPSPEANKFLAYLRQQKNPQSLSVSKEQKSQMQPQENEEQQPNKQPSNGIDLQSESQMEAQLLFDNLMPEAIVEQKAKKPSPKKEVKPKQPKASTKNQTNGNTRVQQQKIIQTKSILKSGKITDENTKKANLNQESPQHKSTPVVEQQQERQVPRKIVRFEGVLPINMEIEKKWDDPIQNQRKGKFDKEEEKILSEAVGKFLVANGISLQQFESLLSAGQRSEKVSRKQKIFSLLSTVVPNRSPQSCYKYLKRNFNTLNRKGKWTEEEVQKLKSLVQKYGRKWTLISKQLKRSSDNCYDKFRQLGEQNMDDRVKGIWKFDQLLELLKLIEKMTKIKFLDNSAQKQLEKKESHDAIERQQVATRKYNSKNFIFHNISVIKPYINCKNFQKIDISQIRWNEIATYLKTRNILDCRNKMVQLLQIFFYSESKQLDELIVNFFIAHKYQSEHEIDWKQWKDKHVTAGQAKNRFMIMKKMVEGRSVMPFKQIVLQLKKRVDAKLISKSLEKPQKTK